MWGGVRVDWFLCLQLSFFYPFAVAGDTGTGRTPFTEKRAHRRGLAGFREVGCVSGFRWDPPGAALQRPLAATTPEGWACLNTAFPLSPSGAWGCIDADVAGVLGSSTGLAALIPRNELFAVPGVDEDQPVIIFKFAIIDLGKSNCDKNELIIKFISEINPPRLSSWLEPGRGSQAFPPPSPRAKPGWFGWGAS